MVGSKLNLVTGNSHPRSLLLMVCSLFFIWSCEKTIPKASENVPSLYPEIKLIGDSFISIHVGGQFLDPGAMVYDTFNRSNALIYAVRNTVNNLVPGMYEVVYEANNKYGFRTEQVRWVAVTEIPDAENISGNYTETVSGQKVTVSRLKRGIYRCDNIGGVIGNPAFVKDMYFVQLTDSTLRFPPQSGALGVTGSKNEQIIRTSADTMLIWEVHGPGFSPNRRIFSRD